MSIFTVQTGANDIEAIMGAVADALRQWEGGQVAPLDLALVKAQGERLTERAAQLKLQWNVDGNSIIHSTRPGLGPWIIRFQMVVRRLTWWFLEPILLQIRLFQMNAAYTVDGLAQGQEALATRVLEMSDLRRRIEALEAQQDLTGLKDLSGLEDLTGLTDEQDGA